MFIQCKLLYTTEQQMRIQRYGIYHVQPFWEYKYLTEEKDGTAMLKKQLPMQQFFFLTKREEYNKDN